MDVAFTTQNDGLTSHNLICVVETSGTPRTGDVIEIDDFIYTVEAVEWHIDTRDSDREDFTIGNLHDVIVRLKKVGPA